MEGNLLKVVMLVINNFTNDARVHREAATLAGKGYRVTVIALKDSSTPGEERLDNFYVRRINLGTRFLPRVPGCQIIKYLEFIIRAVILAVRLRAAVYHAHDLNALLPAYISARIRGAYLVYDTHELATGQNTVRRRIWGEMSLWFYLERWLIKKAHLVITVSDEIAEELVWLYKIERPCVIINCPPYEEVPRNNLLREHFGFLPNEIIVIYQGVFGPNRGLKALVDAFVCLPGEFKLVLLGPDNFYKESVIKRATNLKLTRRVFSHAAVPVDDVVRYVASADVGTFLSNPKIKSQRLGLPNKLFECMAAGTPIVVGTICRELVLRLGVGVACDQGNPVSVAEAIKTLAGDRELYLQASLNGREFARSEYNWQVQGEKLCGLYSGMLHQRTISGPAA